MSAAVHTAWLPAPRFVTAAWIAGTLVAGCGAIPGVPPQPVVPQGRSGGVAGFIVDEAGRPIAGATLVASCQQADLETTSDGRGWYDLGIVGLDPGPCVIKGATLDGAVFVAEVIVVQGTSKRVDFTVRAS